MKTGSHRAMIFTPPAADVREVREQDRKKESVEADPGEAVLLYGRMLGDVEILHAELNRLLFAGADYRSALRVIRSAAGRLRDRAGKLLGEDGRADS